MLLNRINIRQLLSAVGLTLALFNFANATEAAVPELPYNPQSYYPPMPLPSLGELTVIIGDATRLANEFIRLDRGIDEELKKTIGKDTVSLIQDLKLHSKGLCFDEKTPCSEQLKRAYLKFYGVKKLPPGMKDKFIAYENARNIEFEMLAASQENVGVSSNQAVDMALTISARNGNGFPPLKKKKSNKRSI
jgi:hypothetical protein